jgi:pimeloyl-ACP methyl ester carboxylesterase
LPTRTSENTPADTLPGWWQWALSRPGRPGTLNSEAGRIHYLQWGDDPGKPPLLLAHGFRAHAHWWDMVAPFLAEQYRVYALDFTGMGDSDHRTEYTSNCHREDIVALIEQLGLGPVTAVGHSFGGGRLLQACAWRPDLFDHAVVVDTHQLFEGVDIPDDPVVQKKSRLYPDFESGIQRFRLAPEQPESLDCLVRHVGRHSLRQVKGGWTWKFDQAMTSATFAVAEADRLLPTVTTPVDVVYGSLSLVVPDDMAHRVHAELGNPGKRVCIPDGHHHLMLDQPVALISVLRALL